MPQMMPMNWILLYFYTIFTLMVLLIVFYYLIIFTMMNIQPKIKLKKLFKWFW